MRKRKHRIRTTLRLAVLFLLVGVLFELSLEHRHLPWRTLAIDDRAGFATGFKMRIIDLGPDSWCSNLLATSNLLETVELDALDGEGDCGWRQAYHLDKSDGITLTGNSTYAMQCNLVTGAHIWLRSIDAHARDILDSSLARVHHVGTYSCRRMYNRSDTRLSKHAFAKAWDVTGFELEDGRLISVLKHWNDPGPNHQFLRAVHNDACRVFNVTLGPDYNAAHRDHFHVDVGGGAVCR